MYLGLGRILRVHAGTYEKTQTQKCTRTATNKQTQKYTRAACTFEKRTGKNLGFRGISILPRPDFSTSALAKACIQD